MILEKLIIYNFRSYYGRKVFEFGKRLNLILGANGDGKTTFFEAMNWVLTPDYAPKSDENRLADDSTLVSAKMFKELKVGEQGKVLVSLLLRNNDNRERIVERSFNVTKTVNGGMQILGRSFKAYSLTGTRRKEMFSLRDLFEGENVFPAVIKKYHLFKGEDKLDIFNDKTTLQTLIDLFSDIKDIDPYTQFAKFALDMSSSKVNEAKSKEDKQNSKILELQTEINKLAKKLEQAETALTSTRQTFNESKKNIDNIDDDFELIKKAAKIEEKVKSTNSEIAYLSGKIDLEYSYRMLDDQWILMGFTPILNEFNKKMASLCMSKQNIENEYEKKQRDEYTKNKIEKAKSELEKIAWRQSDINNLNFSLRTRRCIYCGCEAPDGSVRYDFLKQRLNDVIDILTPKEDEKPIEIKRYFSYRNVETLKEMGLGLEYTGKDKLTISDEISSLSKRNNDIEQDIAKKKGKIAKLEKQIADLYASSSSGVNLRDYVKDIDIVNKWHEEKENSALEISQLTTQVIPNLKKEISKKRDALAKSIKASGSSNLYHINEFFRIFSDAIEETKDATYKEFLDRLAKEANKYLALLNVDDFTGIIKIYIDINGELRIELQDKTDKILSNPNTSLLTTMHISILLAISELTKENRNAEYPLIFDAPTSSFDEGKDKTFYECLNSQVDKQCIVVTKSYLYKDTNGEYVEDRDGLSKLNCKKYRIKKMTGFDKLDIATIDTEVEEID